MTPRTEHIAALLRGAREAKALSQRQLSALSGVRQSQISKIEQGTVDLRLSSLIELTRALDLELTLVPRRAVPAVQSMVRTAVTPSANSRQTRRALKDLRSLEQTIGSNFTSLQL